MTAICQNSLIDAPWMADVTRRLPGVQPLDPKTWIVVDDAYAAQMAERANVLRDHREDVLMALPEAAEAARELLGVVLAHLAERDEFDVDQHICRRPDGTVVELDANAPLETLNRLVCEDFCILQKREGEHVLTAGLLCFPASWSLAEKIGHPLTRIHAPVTDYDENIARRVQRLFDAVQVGRPLWRANALRYVDPSLHQPRTETARRDEKEVGRYIRTERQCILRLPETGAVVFSIQTRQIEMDNLSIDQSAALADHPITSSVEDLND